MTARPAPVVRVLSGAADVCAHSAELAALLADGPLTARWPWLSCWIETHPSWTPEVVTLWRDVEGSEQLVGAAPLARRRRGPVLEVVGLGHGQSDYSRLPAAGPQDAAALAGAVCAWLQALRLPWRLMIDQLQPGDPVLHALHGGLRHAVLLPGDGAPVVELDQGVDPVERMSKSARQSARSGANRARTDGRSLELWWTRDATQMRPYWSEVEALHRSRDRELRGSSDLDEPEQRAFWQTMHRREAEAGRLELATVRVDGRLAGYVLGLLDGSVYRVWDTRIAGDLARYNPGHVLRAAVLSRLAADGRTTACDWMRGVEPYKLAMTARVDPAEKLRAWSSAPLRRGESTARRLMAARRERAVPCAS